MSAEALMHRLMLVVDMAETGWQRGYNQADRMRPEDISRCLHAAAAAYDGARGIPSVPVAIIPIRGEVS